MRYPIDIMTGEENLNGKTASLRAYWCPQSEHTGLTETILDKAANYNHGNIARVSNESVPAFRNVSKMCGEWFKSRFMVPEGQVLKLIGRRSNAGKTEAYASMYIRIRASAALRERRLTLTKHSRSLNLFAYVNGNFDVLSIDQVQSYGIPIPRHFMQFAESVRVAGAFEDVIFEEEKESIPNIEMTSIASVANAKNENRVVIAKPVHKIGRR